MTEKETKKNKRKRILAKLLIDIWGAALLVLFLHFVILVPYNKYCGNVSNWQLVGIMTLCGIIFAFISISTANVAVLLYMMADLYFTATEEIMNLDCTYCDMPEDKEELNDGKAEQEPQETV